MLKVKAKIHMENLITLDELERMTGVEAGRWLEWIRLGDLDASKFVGILPQGHSPSNGSIVVSLPKVRTFIEDWNKRRPKIEFNLGNKQDYHSYLTYNRTIGEPSDE
jgi:hypothetical protein